MTVGKLLIGAAALSVVAVLVPAALAERPDDREGVIGVGAVATETTPFTSVGTAESMQPPFGGGQVSGPASVVRPDDRVGPIGVGVVGQPEPTPVTPVASPGTDWSDPFVVGAIAAVIALLGITVVYVVEHGRRGGGTSGRGTPGRPATTH